jgi:hypothetical protein
MSIEKAQFEQDYCKESDITLEEYHQHFITLPCTCDAPECRGWACVISVENHNKLYNRVR